MTFRDIRARVLIALGIGALVMGATTSWLLGSQLVRPVNRPVPLPAGFPAQVVSLPGPGHAIAGWWLNQGGDSPVVLLLHSIRADRSSMLSRAKLLLGHGFSVLLIDLQGHGETPGVAITMGSRESGDVRAALGWLKRTVPSLSRTESASGWDRSRLHSRRCCSSSSNRGCTSRRGTLSRFVRSTAWGHRFSWSQGRATSTEHSRSPKSFSVRQSNQNDCG